MRSKTSWLPFFSWCWEDHFLSFCPLYNPSSPGRSVMCLPWGLQACVKWRPSHHHVCLCFLSSWGVLAAGSWCFYGCSVFCSYTSAWCETAGAARFGLPPWLLVTEVGCGKCEGKIHVLGAGCENVQLSHVSGGTGHSVQNSTQGRGKVFSFQLVLLLCTFVYSSLWPVIFMLMQLLQR